MFLSRLIRNNFLKEKKISQLIISNKKFKYELYPPYFTFRNNYDYHKIKSIRLRITKEPLINSNDKKFLKILKSYLWGYQNSLKFLKKKNFNKNINILIFNGRMPIDSGILKACEELNYKNIMYHEMNTYNGKYHYKFTPWHELKNFDIEIKSLLKNKNKGKIIAEARSFMRYLGCHSFKKKNNVNKKIILFICSTINEFYWHYKKPINQIEIIKKLLMNEKLKSEYDLIIRVHPNLKNTNEYQQNLWYLLKEQYRENVILHTENINTYDILRNSKLSISIGSSTAPQSIILKVPHIIIGEQNPYSKMNFCSIVSEDFFLKKYEKIINENMKMLISDNKILRASASLIYENNFGENFKTALLSKNIFEKRKKFIVN